MNPRPSLSTISMILGLWMVLGNCYFNPAVNGILNPLEEENNNSFLGLLGFAGETPTLITGQIRDPNGVALSNLVLETGLTFAQEKNTTPTFTTDTSGRFYIPYQTGSISFTVKMEGAYFFEFTLLVSNPNSIAYTTYGAPPGLEITGLGTLNANESPNFFELIDSTPRHNTTVNFYLTQMIFTFSEPPIPTIESGPMVTDWISQNIEISPSASFDNFMNVADNTLTINFISLPTYTIYDLTLKPGVFSATGKPLTQRTIHFSYQHNP